MTYCYVGFLQLVVDCSIALPYSEAASPGSSAFAFRGIDLVHLTVLPYQEMMGHPLSMDQIVNHRMNLAFLHLDSKMMQRTTIHFSYRMDLSFFSDRIRQGDMLVRPNQTCDGFVTDTREDREREKERKRNGFESVSNTGYFKLFISSVNLSLR